MSIQELHRNALLSVHTQKSALLCFEGVPGYDVYNTTTPFCWQGKTYIFGRVEKREEWASSTTRLFEEIAPETYRLVPNAMIYPLEDPFVTLVHGELVLGGTFVYKISGQVAGYHVRFYRGTDLRELAHFTTGPDGMKDIRLVELLDGKIGVFSRHRSAKISEKYNTDAVIGYTQIKSLDELTPQIVDQARLLPPLFGPGEWGGCNELHTLKDGRIGIIGHQSWQEVFERDALTLSVYTAISFCFDPVSWTIEDVRLIGTRACFPDAPCKKPYLADCVFPSGIRPVGDGKKAWLYCGLGDTLEGRCLIDHPFA